MRRRFLRESASMTLLFVAEKNIRTHLVIILRKILMWGAPTRAELDASALVFFLNSFSF